MKKRLTSIVLVSILLLFTIFISVAYGDNIVEIFIDKVNVQINGKPEDIPNLLYNNKTYVSLREVCNVLGVDLKWDAATNTVKINYAANSNFDNKNSILDAIIYIFSKVFLISGLILSIQVVFSRAKKDFYFVRKFDSSNTSLKRLIYTSCINRMGFYYIAIGTIISFKSMSSVPPLWARLVFIPILVLVFWFLGMSAANSISRREQIETMSGQD